MKSKSRDETPSRFAFLLRRRTTQQRHLTLCRSSRRHFVPGVAATAVTDLKGSASCSAVRHVQAIAQATQHGACVGVKISLAHSLALTRTHSLSPLFFIAPTCLQANAYAANSSRPTRSMCILTTVCGSWTPMSRRSRLRGRNAPVSASEILHQE